MSTQRLPIHALRFNPLKTSIPNLVALGIAALGCGVSLLLTIQFIAGLRMASSSGADQFVGCAIGIVWEASKYLFIPLGLLHLGRSELQKRFEGAGLLFLGGLLISGSVVASLGFLLEVDAKSTRLTAQTSQAYLASARRQAGLQSQIEVLTLSASVDAQTNFRGRSLATMAKVRELQAEVDQLNVQLQTMEKRGGQPKQSGLFFGLGQAFNPSNAESSAERFRLIAYAVVALMLEICSMIGLTLVSQKAQTTPGAELEITAPSIANSQLTLPLESTPSIAAAPAFKSSSAPQPETKDIVELHPVPESIAPKAPKPAPTRAEEKAPLPNLRIKISDIRNKISDIGPKPSSDTTEPPMAPRKTRSTSSMVGSTPKFNQCVQTAQTLFQQEKLRPTIIDVRRHFKIGQPKAAELLSTCFERGALQRKGRGYVLAAREAA